MKRSTLHARLEDGTTLHLLLWQFDTPMQVASTAAVGGGIGLKDWVLNVGVSSGYARIDPDRHIAELAAQLGLDGDGVGMLTAADVTHVQWADDGGATVEATVGLSHPTWAAAPDEGVDDIDLVGTVNVVGFIPARLDDAGLLNALCTITEAKSQAFAGAGIDGSGTPTDAVTLVCPAGPPTARFGGPRSRWGSRLARAAYAAITLGCPSGSTPTT